MPYEKNTKTKIAYIVKRQKEKLVWFLKLIKGLEYKHKEEFLVRDGGRTGHKYKYNRLDV